MLKLEQSKCDINITLDIFYRYRMGQSEISMYKKYMYMFPNKKTNLNIICKFIMHEFNNTL